MCGIVGGIAERNVTPILLEGLKRLEYRGYDSSGIALIDNENRRLMRERSAGKIKNLESKLYDQSGKKEGFRGNVGIAHTRWATHGAPEEKNAHPHMCGDRLAVVHNGIIENFAELKKEFRDKDYSFSSDTDTEVIAYSVYDNLKNSEDLFESVKKSVETFEGAYALGVISKDNPDTLIAARKGVNTEIEFPEITG
ncbi:Glutamine--fructose-6-phosphate transaminase (isomerizing) [Flexistipes sinusarabici DSM 4947]|uniref:Glutamine--fructose-6-phosphate aminotransferase [isomerizing] n=1 Tax=Flexistipes sinusarabici (strain ATCC 49648 / DSM 4947 / MAS 10) TaxID=717231 RepID=F8E452_FLESM|nr:class II glutamine amidotransferase [Flexistipes sinusarabici]AEI14405.1 Glutamine--fructose-6-phosphate transaminase (isomerizing) [Flexistipes sinusarabici DSM 4947]